MATYTPSTAEVDTIVAKAIHMYHGKLEEAGVRVQVLMARGDVDKEGNQKPAIKVGGYPALASIKIYSLKDRVATGYAARMEIDADQWEIDLKEQRLAMVDHELEHLDLVYDSEDGSIKVDDAEMPKLKMVRHDMQVGWFHAVAQRHGSNSCEVRQAKAFVESATYTQAYLPGIDGDEPEEDAA